MTDYISRDAALAFQNELEPVMCKSIHSGGIYSATRDDDLVRFLSAIPAADVVPVVRCKDCKHSAIDYIGLLYCKGVTYYNHVPEDWYCADGERKDMVTDCNQVKDGDGDV